MATVVTDSATHITIDKEDQARPFLVEIELDLDGRSTTTMAARMTPSEAREIAALLLHHAERIEATFR